MRRELLGGWALFPLALAPVCATLPAGVEAQERVDIQGQVLDAVTRQPLEGVLVDLLGLDVSLVTDSLGYFYLWDAPVGTYELQMTRRGYEPASGSFSILRPGAFTTTMNPVPGMGGAEPGRMVGRVTDAGSGDPLVGARVRLPGVYLDGLTDEEGRFVFGQVPPGRHAVEFSTLGYATRVDTITVTGGLTSDARVAMAVDPVRLEPIEVVVERREVALEAVGFYRRREFATGGDFIDRQTIEDQNPVEMVDIFRRLNGVEFRLADPFNPSTRAIILRGGKRENPPCYPSVYLDGVLVHIAGDGPAMLNQLVVPDQIAGMEVYQGGASMPLEYGGTNASCGAVVLWTRK